MTLPIWLNGERGIFTSRKDNRKKGGGWQTHNAIKHILRYLSRFLPSVTSTARHLAACAFREDVTHNAFKASALAVLAALGLSFTSANAATALVVRISQID